MQAFYNIIHFIIFKFCLLRKVQRELLEEGRIEDEDERRANFKNENEEREMLTEQVEI